MIKLWSTVVRLEMIMLSVINSFYSFAIDNTRIYFNVASPNSTFTSCGGLYIMRTTGRPAFAGSYETPKTIQNLQCRRQCQINVGDAARIARLIWTWRWINNSHNHTCNTTQLMNTFQEAKLAILFQFGTT